MTTQVRGTASPDDEAPPLAGTPRRRFAVSMFVIVTLVAIGTSVMPDSVIKYEALTVTRPYLGVTGLDQSWGVFAPDPRRQTSTVLTVVDRADGTSVTIPQADAAGPEQYWDYRWRLLLTQLGARDRDDDRRAYAEWIADQERAAGHEPVRVSLVRRSATLAPPGPGPDQSPWTETWISSTRVAR